MQTISEEETKILIQKYGVLDSFDKLKDERARDIADSCGSLLPISEFFSSYRFVQNKLFEISNSNKAKRLDVLLEYQRSIFQEIKAGLSNLASNKPKAVSPSDFSFILEVAKNNLIYSMINYELTKSEVITLPVQCSVVNGLIKGDFDRYEFGIISTKYFFQKSANKNFHNLNGEITEMIGYSKLEFYSSIIESCIPLF